MMEGVTVHPLKHIVVPKGDIYHALKSTDEGYVGFGEAYFSQIEHGAAKGWKRHTRMTLILVVPVGAVTPSIIIPPILNVVLRQP